MFHTWAQSLKCWLPPLSSTAKESDRPLQHHRKSGRRCWQSSERTRAHQLTLTTTYEYLEGSERRRQGSGATDEMLGIGRKDRSIEFLAVFLYFSVQSMLFAHALPTRSINNILFHSIIIFLCDIT